MIIFIDESGIHKSKDHSCIALVYIEIENLLAIENAVLGVEKKLKLTFHWAHSVWEVRREFFRVISGLDFLIKVAIIRNPINLGKELEEVLLHLIIEKNIKQIVIDGKKSRRYERKLKKILRDKGISTKKLRTVRDESFAGIRLADAIAGAVRYYYDNPESQAKELFNKIKDKIIITLQK